MTRRTRTQNSLPLADRRTLLVIFLLSATGLAYEVTLTRLFSVIVQYHYVFLIVSVSIMGLSIGAALATLVTRRKNWQVQWDDLAVTGVLLAALLVGVAVVISQLRSAELTGVLLAAAVLPFAAIGFLNAVLFSAFARQGGVLYAADLIGGAVGLAASLAVIGLFGAFDSILALAVVSAGVAGILAWIGGQYRLQRRVLAVVVVLLIGFVTNRATGLIAFSPGYIQDAPPDKTLMTTLQQDAKAAVTETRWDAFARVDLVTTEDDSERFAFTDGGAGSIMVRYDGDNQAVDWMKQDVAYLPFTISPETTQRALIVGAGAGRDVLMARLAGVQAVTAVEINPALVSLTRDYADYNGNILDLPGVQTYVTDGRNFIERTDAQYDLIYANVVYSQAAAPGSSALTESYIFTREALQTYWHHLSDNGRIGFVTHQGVEGIRLLIAALDMMQHEGLTTAQALQQVALASLRIGDPQTRMTVVMVMKQPWTAQQTTDFVDAAHSANAGLLYMPNFQDVSLQSLQLGVVNLQQYIANNADLYNYTPTTDDSPFFYQYTPGLPPGLADLLLVSIIGAFIYLSWLIFFFVRRDGQQWKRAALAPYFALLGAAFLLVETPLIQRFDLLLGQPVLALTTVIGALLVGGGLGSLFSNRYPVESLPRLVTIFAAAAGVMTALLSLAIYPAVIQAALPLDLSIRVIISVVAILPLGFVMGIPFPSGLRIADQADPRGVAAFWGANAATTVLGSALAMILAISFGFSLALLVGAALYLLTAVLARLTWGRLLK